MDPHLIRFCPLVSTLFYREILHSIAFTKGSMFTLKIKRYKWLPLKGGKQALILGMMLSADIISNGKEMRFFSNVKHFSLSVSRCFEKLLICPPLWILTRWHSRLNSKRPLLQRVSREMAPELVLDLCSPLTECPTAPRLNAIWHIFNRFVTFFLYSWIYIRATGVSREASILPFHLSSLMLSLSWRVPPFLWQKCAKRADL